MNKTFRYTSLMAAALLTMPLSAQQAGIEKPAEEEKSTPPETLPVDQIEWSTNMDEPLIGSPDAKKGGELTLAWQSYPETFRLVGPNTNSLFANWARPFSLQLDNSNLTLRHPITDNHIPLMATSWYIDEDNHSVYYKLDERAKWSDGQPVTADDYVFAYDFLTDDRIADPFYNEALPVVIRGVEKIDDYTIRVIGQNPSWRPLDDFDMWPFPSHAINLDEHENWPEETNYDVPITAGPYKIADWKVNEYVTFERVDNWWGDDHHYLQGLFNPQKMTLRIIPDRERHFDFFKKGDLDYLEIYTARTWATEMDFEALNKGWAQAVKVYTESPEGISGIGMNVSKDVINNKDFRKAMQYLFNFEAINSELMFNAYFQKVSSFHGTPYSAPDLEPYGFNPKKAREHLRKAGFTKRGPDGILVNSDNQRAEVTLTYGAKGLEKHLTVLQNFYRRGGIDLKLSLVEPSTAFRNMREKAVEAFYIGMTANYYPAPRQYYHTDFKDKEQTNNFWNFGTPETDKLIETYQFNMNQDARRAAMHELDRIIHDEAFYIPGWYAPYIRFLAWDYIEFPDNYYPRRASSIVDWMTLWINPEKKKALKSSMDSGKALDRPTKIQEFDPYGVKAELDKKFGGK